MSIDDVDQEVLAYLREDARLSYREIGRRVGIPESQVRSRVKRLLDDKVIHFSLVMNPLVEGYRVSAYVRFAAEPRLCRAAAEYLSSREEFIFVSLTGGTHNILTVVLARSNSHLFSLINGDWRAAYGITDMEVQIFFRSHKHRYNLTRQPG